MEPQLLWLCHLGLESCSLQKFNSAERDRGNLSKGGISAKLKLHHVMERKVRPSIQRASLLLPFTSNENHNNTVAFLLCWKSTSSKTILVSLSWWKVSLSAFIFLNLLLKHIFRDLSPYLPFKELNMKTKHQPMWTEQLSLLQKNLRSQVVWKVLNLASLWWPLLSLASHHPASKLATKASNLAFKECWARTIGLSGKNISGSALLCSEKWNGGAPVKEGAG